MNNQTKVGDCEVCEKTNITVTCHYGNMWFCNTCWMREEQHTKQHFTPVTAQETINKLQDVVKTSRSVDETIQVRTDLFNAATTAIVELKKAIDENPEIENKPYALAEELKNKFEHYKQVVFELNQQIIEAGNHQKAIQVYLNNLANTLRVEEREKLKIQDINYKPTSPKSPSVRQVSTRQTRKSTKLDKAELRKYAAELGVAEFTLQMVCVQKGLTPEAAANILRKSIKEAQSEAPTSQNQE